MPSPSVAIAQLRRDLASVVEFDLMRNMAGFIGYRVLPIFNVALQADKFGRIPREQLGKLADVTRTSKGGYNRINFTFEDDNYSTKEYGLEAVVDRRNSRIYADVLESELATTQLVMHTVLAQAEKRVADAIFNPTTFSGQTTNVSIEWSTPATAVPITNVKAASQLVRDRTGRYANALIINRKVMRNLQECAQIHERIHATGAGDKIKPTDITPSMIAQCMDLEEVIVADSSYDTTQEGQSTTFGDIWDDEYAMVACVARTNMVEEACLGRTFHWTGDGSQSSGLVETYYSEEVRGDVVRVRHEVHEKLIYTEAGQLLTNITA